MDDSAFLQAVESCELPEDRFHHRDHIRLAWICADRFGPDAAARISRAIRRYAAHLGKPDRYHETITMAWLHLVRHASRPGESFEQMAARCPELLAKTHLANFYSPQLLDSPQAKIAFVEPDLRPFPAELGHR